MPTVAVEAGRDLLVDCGSGELSTSCTIDAGRRKVETMLQGVFKRLDSFSKVALGADGKHLSGGRNRWVVWFRPSAFPRPTSLSISYSDGPSTDAMAAWVPLPSLEG